MNNIRNSLIEEWEMFKTLTLLAAFNQKELEKMLREKDTSTECPPKIE